MIQEVPGKKIGDLEGEADGGRINIERERDRAPGPHKMGGLHQTSVTRQRAVY